MEIIYETVDALEDVLNLIRMGATQCKCDVDYKCVLCRAEDTLKEARKVIVRGESVVKRPRHKVRCITTDRVFESLKEASVEYDVQSATISKACKGELKYAGRLGETKLQWEYAD